MNQSSEPLETQKVNAVCHIHLTQQDMCTSEKCIYSTSPVAMGRMYSLSCIYDTNKCLLDLPFPRGLQEQERTTVNNTANMWMLRLQNVIHTTRVSQKVTGFLKKAHLL
jgi:hypothetical protein